MAWLGPGVKVSFSLYTIPIYTWLYHFFRICVLPFQTAYLPGINWKSLQGTLAHGVRRPGISEHTLPSRPGSSSATPREFVVAAWTCSQLPHFRLLRRLAILSRRWDRKSCVVVFAPESNASDFQHCGQKRSKTSMIAGVSARMPNLGSKEGNAQELVLPLSFLKWLETQMQQFSGVLITSL